MPPLPAPVTRADGPARSPKGDTGALLLICLDARFVARFPPLLPSLEALIEQTEEPEPPPQIVVLVVFYATNRFNVEEEDVFKLGIHT